MAVQEGPTSIRVSWSPPTPLGDTTGYRISYSGGSSGSVDVSDGSTDNYPLTGLQSGASYTISIVGTSLHLPSEVMEQEATQGETTELHINMYNIGKIIIDIVYTLIFINYVYSCMWLALNDFSSFFLVFHVFMLHLVGE